MFLCTCTVLFILQQLVTLSYGFNNALHIEIQLDSDHRQVELYLFNSSGNIIYEYDYFDDDESSCSTSNHNIAIPDGCFTLLFNDKDRNGICCSQGYGRYEVTLNDRYLTFANLQTFEVDTTQLYFCTHLFQNMSANSSKTLKFTSNHNSRIAINNNDNVTLYLSDDFIPFGKAHDFLLPVDRIDQILIYERSNHEWKKIMILNSTDDWDIQSSSYVEGICV